MACQPPGRHTMPCVLPPILLALMLVALTVCVHATTSVELCLGLARVGLLGCPALFREMHACFFEYMVGSSLP